MSNDEPPFRPERLFITSDYAAELDAAGMEVDKVRYHENGAAELVLAPLGTRAARVMDEFAAACVSSGLGECVCHECGRPWLTRSPGPLCPVCNPHHPGYKPEGPTDRARWLTFWQRGLTGVLRARAADLELGDRILGHATATGTDDPITLRFRGIHQR